MNITTEEGKTLKGAQSDVLRGLGKYFYMHLVAFSFRITAPCCVEIGSLFFFCL